MAELATDTIVQVEAAKEKVALRLHKAIEGKLLRREELSLEEYMNVRTRPY
jgi:hypothetical protein